MAGSALGKHTKPTPSLYGALARPRWRVTPDAPVLLTSGNGVSALKALLGASEPLAEALASRSWAFLVGTAMAEALRGIQFSKTFTATQATGRGWRVWF